MKPVYRGLLLSLLMLAGCSGHKVINPPAALTEITKEVELSWRWQRDVGIGQADYSLLLKPVMDGKAVYAASRDGDVIAWDRESGSVLWRTRLDQRVNAGLGQDETRLVLVTREGRLQILSKADGQVLQDIAMRSSSLTLPVLAANRAYVRYVDSQVAELDLTTGTELWSQDFDSPSLTLRGMSQLVLASGRLLVSLDDGKLVALDAESGSREWEVTVGIPRGRSELERMVDVDATPQVQDGVAYVVGLNGRIMAIELGQGRALWGRDFSSFLSMTMDSRVLYVVDEQSQIWAIDRGTGATLWKQTALSGRRLTAPALLEGHVVVADFEGFIHVLSHDDGHLEGRRRPGPGYYGIAAQPQVSDGQVVFVSRTGKVTLLGIESGNNTKIYPDVHRHPHMRHDHRSGYIAESY